MEFEYKVAEDLDRAWLNSELDLPLPPMPDGSTNPFYVDRPGNPVARLERQLLRPYRQPPKVFFSGHRGCGKSTELHRLAANPQIKARFWPIHFSIRDLADINNLDFKDVLLAIGGQLFNKYQEQSNQRLPKALLKELDTWRGQIEEHVTIVQAGRLESEIETKLSVFFAELAGKIKLEPKTRHEVRQVFDRHVTGLVEVINNIATTIHAQEKRPPLVLIDDLDKPDLQVAKSIFFERREVMLQPVCPIVYTVSSPLFYSQEFEAIKERAIFLPNVKLHTQGKAEERDGDGYYTLRTFVHKRIIAALITDDALDLAAEMSGGVFRELARVIHSSVDRALAVGRAQVQVEDVEGAAAEIRSSYWRILTADQRTLLQQVRRHNRLNEPDKLAPLLQMLAVLEYSNGEPWCDVHPVLKAMLDVLEAEVTGAGNDGNR